VAAELTLLSFYIVGAGIASLWPARLGVAESLVLMWRHAVSPALHLLLSMLLGLSGWGFWSVMVEAVMPPATMNIVIAKYYRLDESLVASTIALSTPLGLLEAIIPLLVFS
jgi:predicted permease